MRIFVLCQVYAPEPTGVGQYMTEACESLVERGHDVTVFTSACGYEDPTIRFPGREERAGVHVRRFGLASFGKRGLFVRAAAAVLFGVHCLVAGLRGRRPDLVMFTTAPPMMGVFAILLARLRSAPALFWAMDLNPDQLIVLGKLDSQGAMARGLRMINRVIYGMCERIIALDPHMAKRLIESGAAPGKTMVSTLWPSDGGLQPINHEANDFRRRQDVGDHILVMYSGNQTRSNPLQTLLDTALAMRADDRFRFFFIGGGTLKPEIENFRSSHGLTSVVIMPYQPREMLSESLSAADIHAITLGEGMVGVIHPCKIYNALAVGRPILYCGPPVSHVADILGRDRVGWAIRHGDVAGAVSALQEFASLSAADRRRLEVRCRTVVDERFSPAALRDRFCELAEGVAGSGL